MDDLKLIKKYYGEDMMHLCRKVFPTILEYPGLLFSIIESNFAHNKFLYNDLINQDMVQGFKNYIYSFTEFKTAEAKTDKTPSELLNEADYVLYECKTDEEIQAFKKYYVFDEEICTFFEDRLSDCYVFFAVKKNVDEIKRENFKLPKRQDEYGVSVISIQFTKGDLNVLSIKNRYNHSVNNPDATYSNNLENIIPGLTYSFEKQYGLNINSNYKGNFELESYVLAKDNKLYKYNYNIGSYYYCPNNIIIDNLGNILTNYVEKEKYIVMDYFILDIVNKKIFTHDPKINDSLNDTFKNIKKIDIRNNKEKNTRIIEIILEDNTSLFIEIDSKNQIIGYVNNHIKSIEDNFLVFNKTLRYISLPQVAKIGRNFLSENLALTSLSFPTLKEIEDNFLYSNIYKSSKNRFLLFFSIPPLFLGSIEA